MKKTILAIALAALTNIHTSQAAPQAAAPFILKLGNAYNPARKYSKGLVVSYEGNAYVALRAVPVGNRPTTSTNLWLRWPSSLDLSAITNQATITILAQALGLDSNSVAIGGNAGYTNQGAGAVAVGGFAGCVSQGGASVAIGSGAGQQTQSSNAVSIGRAAGETDQGVESVAVGFGSGRSSQGTNSVAVGARAGWYGQGNGSTAIGYCAGYTSQGSNAVAIGSFAAGNDGYSSTQPANSIVINATGSYLNATTNGGLYVKPIRITNSSAGLLPLYYNTNTGEIMVVTP
jgi:hypothetical protein